MSRLQRHRPRASLRKQKQHPTNGRHVQSLGLAFGYWPCLGNAPFVTLWFAHYRLDLWFGTPSYMRADRIEGSLPR